MPNGLPEKASQEEAQNGSLGITGGTAIVFNAESRVIDEYGETFREVILPEGCADGVPEQAGHQDEPIASARGHFRTLQSMGLRAI